MSNTGITALYMIPGLSRPKSSENQGGSRLEKEPSRVGSRKETGKVKRKDVGSSCFMGKGKDGRIQEVEAELH